MTMTNPIDYIRKIFHRHSPSKEFEDNIREVEKNKSLTESYLSGYNAGLSYGRQEYIFEKVTPDEIREVCGLDPIIPIDKDKQIVKVLEGKSVIIQFDSLLKKETIEALKEDIQNQIKENGFAVVDGKCKIVEFDNPKYLIETK